MSRITNIVELRESLLEKWELVEDGKMSHETLKAFNGTAGQMIKSALTELLFSRSFDRPVRELTIDFMLDKKEVKKIA